MNNHNINRRKFLGQSIKLFGTAISAPILNQWLSSPAIANTKIANKIFALGIDGMDPVLLQRFVERGEMPTFRKLMKTGYWGHLQTTIPPQSPVAWSSFITGCNPGKHGIFDFIHRDPTQFIPFLSTSRSYEAEKRLSIGKWNLPLKAGKLELLRRSSPFWKKLEAHDIPASFYKLPANFPVKSSKSTMISGMGTPDLLGTYGTFTLFTDQDLILPDSFAGGRIQKLMLQNHLVETNIHGPKNSLRANQAETKIHIAIHRDPWEPTIHLEIQNQNLLLMEGEWSEWVPLKFEFMPLFVVVYGMVRFYVQQVHPYLRLYMSPINIDPMNPQLPIAYPQNYSRELSEAVGRFYTQGFPEDTKALSNGIFSNEEFLQQSKLVLEERLKAFDYEINRFEEGLFFFYFSSIDQNTHMMWHSMDPEHPLYDPSYSSEVKEAVYYLYRSMDEVLKQTLSKMDSRSSLIVLSDHGFAPFGREFHLSTWLVEKGFTVLTDSDKIHEGEYFQHVDWSRTKAYAMGLNGIYINLNGRELRGSVSMTEYGKIKEQIIQELESLRDPSNGYRVVARAFDARKIYTGPEVGLAPDIIVGYQRGYRISDDAVLGKFPKGIIQMRQDKWAADHCMDPALVPGIILTNESVQKQDPALWDLAPSIIQKFGLVVPQEMDGKPIF